MRPDTALSSLFGLVCDTCDAYNDPGQAVCAQCQNPLNGPNTIPVTRAPRPVPVAPPVSAAGRTVTSGGVKAPAVLTVPLPRPSAPSGQSPLQLGNAPGQTRPPAPLQLTHASSAEVTPPPVLQPTPLKLEQPAGGARAPSQAAPLVLTQVVKSESLTCTRCGAANPPEFRFCTECGMALKPLVAKAPVAPPQPVQMGKAAARILRGDRLGQTLRIGMQATAGRGQGPLSFPGDPFLAAYHCTLYFQQNRFFVRDEGSPSGTFVRLREEEPLAPGDTFAIGDHLMRYAGQLTAEMHAADGTRILGCPRPPGLAVQIEEIHEGGVPGRNSVRLAPSIVIGRDDGCDLSFSGDPFVSGRHCNITVGPGGRARIRDLGSTNGTFRRLEAGSERELLKGDCIRIGSEILQIVEEAAPIPLSTTVARKI